MASSTSSIPQVCGLKFLAPPHAHLSKYSSFRILAVLNVIIGMKKNIYNDVRMRKPVIFLVMENMQYG
jgi:hypothetical protein